MQNTRKKTIPPLVYASLLTLGSLCFYYYISKPTGNHSILFGHPLEQSICANKAGLIFLMALFFVPTFWQKQPLSHRVWQIILLGIYLAAGWASLLYLCD